MTATQLVLWLTLAVFLVLAVTVSFANFGRRRPRRVTNNGGYAGDAGPSGSWFGGSGESCGGGPASDGGSCGDGGGGD